MIARYDDHEDFLADREHGLKSAVSSALDVHEQDGKTYLFGMELDPRLGGGVRALMARMTPVINEVGAPTVGSAFRYIAQSVGVKGGALDTAKKVGESTFLWSSVFYQQAIDLYKNTGNYKEKRGELYKEFKPVIEATGAKPSKNEVMQVEYDRANQNWLRSIKGMSADLITLAPNAYIALGQQHDIVKHGTMDVDRLKHLKANEPAKEGGLQKLLTPDNLLTGGSVVSAFSTPYLKEGQIDNSPTAWRMIKKVKAEIDNLCAQKGEGCKFVPPEVKDIRVDGESLPDYIVSVFQQHEVNRGRGKITGTNLEKLEDASILIAEALAKGQVDAYALVTLVGEHKIITRKGHDTIIARDEKVEAALVELATKMGTRVSMTEEEFYSAFGNKSAIEQEIKQNLASLKGLERACFVSLLPDEVLEHVGVKHDDIKNSRAEARDHMHKIVEGFMQDLGQVIEQASPEQLREMGLTKRDIRNVQQFVAAMDGEDKDKALQSVVEGHHKEMLALMASVLLTQQKADPAGAIKSWSERVGAASKPAPAAEAAADKPQEGQASAALAEKNEEHSFAEAVEPAASKFSARLEGPQAPVERFSKPKSPEPVGPRL